MLEYDQETFSRFRLRPNPKVLAKWTFNFVPPAKAYAQQIDSEYHMIF